MAQKSKTRRRLSAPLRIGGTRLWSETRRSHEATAAMRVRKPIRSAEANTAASAKRNASYVEEPPPKWNDQFQKLVKWRQIRARENMPSSEYIASRSVARIPRSTRSKRPIAMRKADRDRGSIAKSRARSVCLEGRAARARSGLGDALSSGPRSCRRSRDLVDFLSIAIEDIPRAVRPLERSDRRLGGGDGCSIPPQRGRLPGLPRHGPLPPHPLPQRLRRVRPALVAEQIRGRTLEEHAAAALAPFRSRDPRSSPPRG
jgi:hypothetical protein